MPATRPFSPGRDDSRRSPIDAISRTENITNYALSPPSRGLFSAVACVCSESCCSTLPARRDEDENVRMKRSPNGGRPSERISIEETTIGRHFKREVRYRAIDIARRRSFKRFILSYSFIVKKARAMRWKTLVAIGWRSCRFPRGVNDKFAPRDERHANSLLRTSCVDLRGERSGRGYTVTTICYIIVARKSRSLSSKSVALTRTRVDRAGVATRRSAARGPKTTLSVQ